MIPCKGRAEKVCFGKTGINLDERVKHTRHIRRGNEISAVLCQNFQSCNGH